MGIIETKTFKSGNSVAVRLPKEFGFHAGAAVSIERDGGNVIIRPSVNPAEEKRKLLEMIERIREAWADCPDHEIGRREPIDIPERPGL